MIPQFSIENEEGKDSLSLFGKGGFNFFLLVTVY
jgi:hypothetical protein